MITEQTLKKTYTIMVVDDDKGVIKFMSRILADDGYKALTFINAVEAFEYFKSNQQEIDLIVTDLVMPDIDGLELIEKIRRHDQQIPVVLMSGDTAALRKIREDSLGINEIAEKPTAIFKIGEIIQNVL